MVSEVLSAGSTERLASTKELGHLSRITSFLAAKPRVECQRSQDSSRQKTGDEVSMGTTESSGSSVMPIAGVPQGDLEETVRGSSYLATKGSGEVQAASYHETETSYMFVVYS